MNPVTGPSAITGNITQLSSAKETQPPEQKEKSLVIEIKPGDNNTTTGDRSQNSVKVSITGPNREVEGEVTREQYYNTVERRTYKNLVQQAAGGNSPGNPAVKAALAVKAGVIDGNDIESLAVAKNQKKQMEVYMNTAQNNPYKPSEDSSSNDFSSDVSSVTTDYYEGVNKNAKQQFVFTKIDQIT